MNTLTDHFHQGFNDGMRPRKVFDPSYKLTSEENDEYRSGYTAARNYRIDSKDTFEFAGESFRIDLSGLRISKEDTHPTPGM